MKLNKYIKYPLGILACGLLSVGFTGCSSDYLETEPKTVLDSSVVSSSVEGAQLGLYGICRAMYCQYGNYQGYMFVNGEPWINMFYGDVLGPDYFSYFWVDRMGHTNYSWRQMNMRNGWMASIVWSYCYNIIMESNNILNGIDTATGSETARDFIKAQVLTLRAHAYIKLLQVFAPRWEDSKNGEQHCMVIRDGKSGNDTPLVTMNQVLELVYGDLDKAIELYKSSNGKRQFNWEPNINVAQGLYARVALIKHDWPTAQKMAHDARQGFSIMTAEQYKQGFSEPNQEWMWNNTANLELYYWGAYSLYGVNCAYPTLWGLGAGAINYDLYLKMADNDIRRDLFFTPDKPLDKKLKPEDFWNEKVVSSVSMDCNSLNRFMVRSVEAFGVSVVPDGDISKWGKPYVPRESNDDPDADGVIIPFGGQYKFWSTDLYGSGAFPFMRGAEMLLAEAEAAYYNNDMATVKANLVELNSQRVPNYTCTASGEALLEEVRLSRRLELWGEGHNWFDFKRWNIDAVNRAWVANDPTSNNIPAADAINHPASEYTGWRFNVPMTESTYNHSIDRSLLGFSNEN